VDLEKRIICCCDKSRCETHIEVIKFKIDFSEERNKNIVVFPQRVKGDLENFEDVNND
jgi:hypothetical protein